MQNKCRISLDKQKQPSYTSTIEKQCLINQFNVEWYLSIDVKRDVIEQPLQDETGTQHE